MSGPRPFRKRPSAVHCRAGHARPQPRSDNKKRAAPIGGGARPLRRCYNKKRAAPFAWGPRGMC